MFKFLRSQAKYFYWVIAATFVAFIFLAWGMDVMGRRGPQAPAEAAGVVNGVEISWQQYEQTARQVEQQLRYQQQDRELTANQRAMAREQAWDQLVRQAIFDQELARLDIGVSDDEILDIFKNRPPQAILQAYADETGRPNMEAYYADLANPARDWSRMEAYVRYLVPRQKLEEMITTDVVVTEDEVREAYLRQNGRAVVEYMGVALSSVEDEWEPSDEEIQAYYEAHPGEFFRGPQAEAEVAAWQLEASETDQQEVRNLALDVKREIESGERTFEEAAEIFSEDATAQNGGDLGTFDRSRMVGPFTEAAFSLPVGQISDPVQTQFGYHLIEVLERIDEDGDGEIDQVHARHILFKVTPGEDTLNDLYERASEFRDAATPATFADLAQADTTCAYLEPRPFGEGRDIPGLRQSAAGSNFAFDAKAGTISQVFTNDDHYYVVLARGVEPAGPQPLDNVQAQIKLSLKRERQQKAAADLLSPAVGRVQMGEDMAAVAEEAGLIHAVSDTLTATTHIGEIGYAPAFNQLALESEPGTLIPRVDTNRGVFAFRTVWVNPFDEQDYLARRDTLRAMIAANKRNAELEAWLQQKLAEADIQDLRSRARGGATS